MRTIVAIMLAIMVSFQPSLSFGDDSESTFQIVPFSSLVEEKEDRWWEDTRMDMDKNRMHDMLDIALEQGKYVHDGKISVLSLIHI